MSEVGVWVAGRWQWNLEWRRELFGRELGMLNCMSSWLTGFSPTTDETDRWTWVREGSGVFSVSSAYDYLRGDGAASESEIFSKLWAIQAPSNHVALAWKILINRIQTKVNLQRRNALHPSVSNHCVLCAQHEETSSHLFFSCPVVWRIWMQVYSWLGFYTVLPEEGVSHFSQHVVGCGRMDKILRMIWVATVASIWSFRNKVIFKNGISDSSGILELIQYQSWLWCKVKVSDFHYSVFEWIMNPLVCIKSVIH